jgi:hypothetical protein
MQRQRRQDQVGTQHFRSQLDVAMGDHGMDHKRMYAKAAKLRGLVIDTLPEGDDWPELATYRNTGLPKDREAVVQRVLSTCGVHLTDAEKSVVRTLLFDARVDKLSMVQWDSMRKNKERSIKENASKLPVYEWWCGIRGCNGLGLGLIIGCTGDLSRYDNPGKVWRRLGLAPYKNKACSTWRMAGGLSSDEWQQIGYSPKRRSVVYNIGDSLIKQGDEYRKVFLERKRFEFEKARKEGLAVVTTQRATADNWVKVGLPRPEVVKKFDRKEHRLASHVHARAQRYMEKRLLKDLWKQWNPRSVKSQEELQTTWAEV